MENVQDKGALGPWMSLSLVIGTMVGSGIFFLPTSLAPLGWNAVIGWAVSGAGALCLAMTLRFLMDGTGQGIQHNIERILGEIPGFVTVWAYWSSGFTSIAALSIMSGSIIAGLASADPSQEMRVILALVIVWMLVAINLAGTRSSGSFQVLTVLLKLIPLLAVIAVAGWVLAGAAPVLAPAPLPVNLDNISGAVALTLFALLGFEAACVPVCKIRNPNRNIPLALIGGTAFVVALYIAVTTGMMLVVPWETIAASSSPVSDVLGTFFGPITGTFMALLIFVSVTGCTNGLFLISADASYSMALRREIPRAFAHKNARGVPDVGVIVQGVGASLLIIANMSLGLTGMFTFLVLLTSGAVLVFYSFGAFAALRENRKPSRWPVLAIGLLFAAYAIYGSGRETVMWVGVLLLVGLVVRYACKRAAAKPVQAAATPQP